MRITNNMMSNKLILTLQRQQSMMNQKQESISSGKRINRPSDDPVGIANRMFLSTRITEINQYSDNITYSVENLNLTDGYLANATEILHRVRELAVQAANGTYSIFELKDIIAKEVNQHLNGLFHLGNVSDATGRSMFGGSFIERPPFVATFQDDIGYQDEKERYITGVEYIGDVLPQTLEIEQREVLEIGVSGNKVFGGTNTSIESSADSSDYVVESQQSFSIDGHSIEVFSGDTLKEIVAKINGAAVDVQATIGIDSNITLTTTTPHSIFLEDLNGLVLERLGLVDSTIGSPPQNINQGAIVSGSSLFDVLLQFRENLINGNQLLIGGQNLAAIDVAFENLQSVRAEIGSKQNRLEHHNERLEWDKVYMKELLSKNESVDAAEAIMELKWIEQIHNYSLNIGSRLIKPTLVDFLR